ncbi:MAG: HdaA/DnaA family protein, partial [Alphaproteobacteria bacterium]
PCNSEALAWIEQWPDWPASGLAIYGPGGCGKSHLAQVWREQSGASEVSPAALGDLDLRGLLAKSPAVIIEDADGGLDDEAEGALFHLYNLCQEKGASLLLTGQAAPARWPVRLADLRSRLSALPTAAIGRPDDLLIEAVLGKLFADRQLNVGTDVIRFLQLRMERSFAAARATVEALDRQALARMQPITISMVREILVESDHGESR